MLRGEAPGIATHTRARGSAWEVELRTGTETRFAKVPLCRFRTIPISSMQRFNVTEQDLRPGCRDIQIEGELDLAVAGQLDEVLTTAIAECNCVLVGLERCEFIDSSGIAVILRAHNRMEADGNRLAVYAPTAQVLRVLSMTGLTSNGLVFDSAEQALAAGGGTAAEQG